MLEYILPRHLQIIYEINALFLKVHALEHIFADLKYIVLENLVHACTWLAKSTCDFES